MRAVLQRALLVGVGLVVGLMLLEAMLRLAAAVLPQRLQRATVTRDERPPEPDEVRILCVGDSHTYGVGVSPDESYPAQLERLLRERGVRARVVNAGVPGQNSGQLRERLPSKLAEHRPHVVLVWVGANNQWLPTGDEAARPAERVWSRLRLARLARLLFTRHEGVTGDFRRDLDQAVAQYGHVPQELGRPGRPLRSIEVTADLTRTDLGPIIALVRQANALPVLLTYPVPLGPLLTAIDRAIVDAGAATRTRVIDLHQMARRHMPRVPKLLQPDMHPTARFYRAIGWEIARTFLREGIVGPAGAGEGAWNGSHSPSPEPPDVACSRPPPTRDEVLGRL
jgi:lysophospholipase L1-like esterase